MYRKYRYIKGMLTCSSKSIFLVSISFILNNSKLKHKNLTFFFSFEGYNGCILVVLEN